MIAMIGVDSDRGVEVGVDHPLSCASIGIGCA